MKEFCWMRCKTMFFTCRGISTSWAVVATIFKTCVSVFFLSVLLNRKFNNLKLTGLRHHVCIMWARLRDTVQKLGNWKRRRTAILFSHSGLMDVPLLTRAVLFSPRVFGDVNTICPGTYATIFHDSGTLIPKWPNLHTTGAISLVNWGVSWYLLWWSFMDWEGFEL